MNEQTNTNNLYKAIAIIALAFSLLAGYVMFQKESAYRAGGAGQRIREGGDNSSMSTASATTTAQGAPTAFLVGGVSSSTLTFDSSDLLGLSTEMSWFATRTVNSVVQIRMYSSGNGVDFYKYDLSQFDMTDLSNGSLTVAASSTPEALLWSPATSNSSTTVATKLPFIPAKKTRIEFGLATSSQGVGMRDTIGFHANVVGQVSGNQ